MWIATLRSKLSGLLEEELITIFRFTHIQDITLGAGKEVGEVSGGTSGMDEDRGR